MYYSRQIVLPEIGVEGQKKLGRSRVLVVGAGGLGCPALLYLAAAGVGTIGICDGDRLDESNLHRQPLYAAKDVGKYKVNLAKNRLMELNPHIQIEAHPCRLNAKNGIALFEKYDIILDCTDNFQTKFLINDAAFLTQKPVVRASIYQFEGQIQTYIPTRNDPCLRCLWAETPQDGCVGTCSQVGVLGPVPGFFGVLQGVEALKWILEMGVLSSGQILFSDLIGYTQQLITFEKNGSCPLCGHSPTIQKLTELSWELEPHEIQGFQLVDIRELHEIESDCYQGSCLHMPLSSFNASDLKSDVPYAIFCQKGRRSAHLVQILRDQGFSKVFSVIGGIESLRD